MTGSEILVQMTHSRPLTGDPLVDSKSWRPGDVIAAREIGHSGWGRMELALPMFRVVRLPHIPITVARMWLTAEKSDRPTPSRTLQMRMHSFHYEHDRIPKDLQRCFHAHDGRQRPVWDLHEARLTAEDPAHIHYRELMVRKPVILDPDLV